MRSPQRPWPCPRPRLRPLRPRLRPRLQVLGEGSLHLAVLAHPAVRAVVSHCGLAAAQEVMSVAGGKVGLVCLPLLPEHWDVSAKARDNGAALVLDSRALLAAGAHAIRALQDGGGGDDDEAAATEAKGSGWAARSAPWPAVAEANRSIVAAMDSSPGSTSRSLPNPRSLPYRPFFAAPSFCSRSGSSLF